MLLDAFAVIAFVAGEPAAEEVDVLLSDQSDTPAISAANLAEVVDRLVRVTGADLGDVLQKVLLLRRAGLEVVPVEAFDGVGAGTFRSKFYDRRTRPLSMADCTALITARHHGHRLATADPPLADVAREIGIEVVALPDSQGRRPSVPGGQ